ncbi:hypothetical protein [Clostridium akagii]|uniref:hypothetical protein n=1 Tax=Clostridium akagii TaxID=91623 RepID=UPI0004787F17|nr:hypothetical protein [Clostridium akagii]
MKEIFTKYGLIKGISDIEYYNDNNIKECKLDKYCEMTTSIGTFVPQYEDDGSRRKYTKSLSFYKDGNIRTISLDKQTNVRTSVGEIPAEFISFYENGNIKRILPLNGKITAFWTEENEYELATELNFDFEFAKFTKKIIGIKFYETAQVKSLTFWPTDRVNIQTPCGIADIRIGLSLYEDGKLKSCEPSKPLKVKTSIGNIMAYDVNAIGINGDDNSLNFYGDGKVKSLVTSMGKIKVTSSKGLLSIFEPGLKISSYNDESKDIVPLYIEFYDDKIRFNKDANGEFLIEDNSFIIEDFMKKFDSSCNSCEGCESNCKS